MDRSMDRSRIKQLTEYLNRILRPAVVIDNEFKCICSNRKSIFPVNSSIACYFRKPIALPLMSEQINTAVIRGVPYCVKTVPIGFGQNICEFFNYRALLRIAENTDLCERLLPVLGSVEYNTAVLWRLKNDLENKLERDGVPGYSDIVYQFTGHLNELSSTMKNIIEYINMMVYDPTETKPLNIAHLLRSMTDRCNELMCPSQRCIRYLCDESEIYIDADFRHAVAAMINAIQNAVIYSPRDTVPVVSLTEMPEKNTMLLRVVNRTVADDKDTDLNSDYFNSINMRLGCGIPILRRFAQLTGGNLTFTRTGNTLEAAMTIPTILKERVHNDLVSLRCDAEIGYTTGVPDIITMMMKEVNDLFSA